MSEDVPDIPVDVCELEDGFSDEDISMEIEEIDSDGSSWDSGDDSIQTIQSKWDKACITSDLNTDVEMQENPVRECKRPRRLRESSSSLSEEEDDPEHLRRPPPLPLKIARPREEPTYTELSTVTCLSDMEAEGPLHHTDQQQTCLTEIPRRPQTCLTEIPWRPQTRLPQTHQLIPATCTAVERLILEQQGELHLKVDHIMALLQQLLQNRDVERGEEQRREYDQKIPLTSAQDLDDFDELLDSDSNFKKYMWQLEACVCTLSTFMVVLVRGLCVCLYIVYVHGRFS
ncbi:uncharacterized protein LOC132872352 [Neoarius graeffei]|uniref:uncharacterized protein LOC132872352 n=1 Tax=Neoarius graeffei TaxID=443677 RepID=UPI00298D5674|nr:uncharacterized protein LOC132872352 [Neoarius graeffei]